MSFDIDAHARILGYIEDPAHVQKLVDLWMDCNCLEVEQRANPENVETKTTLSAVAPVFVPGSTVHGG